MQHGQKPTSTDACCIDISDATSTRSKNIITAPGGGFTGQFVQGKNIWSDNVAHNDAAYAAHNTTCTNTAGKTLGMCNREWYVKVTGEGGFVASGFGKQSIIGLANSLGQPKELTDLLSGVYNQVVDGDKYEVFRCVRPAYNTVLNTKLGGDSEATCNNFEEGFNIIAKYTSMDAGIHPNPEPRKALPDCTVSGDCEFKSADGPGGEGYIAPGTTWTDR